MKPFLQRFLEEVDDNLGDPHAAKRLSADKKIRDLHLLDRMLFEALLDANLIEGVLGYAEKTITLEADRRFYPLPDGFRAFYDLTKTADDGSTRRGNTKGFFEKGAGIQILTPSRGMRLDPLPATAALGDWTLVYAKATPLLHYAVAKEVGDKMIRLGEPGADAGELVRVEGYYDGIEIRAVSANVGAPQSRVVASSTVNGNGDVVCQLRDAWTPKPTGTVVYEISPTLPPPYDSIYAADVALLNLDRRQQHTKAERLKLWRSHLWNGAKNYLQMNTFDRAHKNTFPPEGIDRMPSGDMR